MSWQDYQIQFVVSNGQLNAFAVARIDMVDPLDALNPLNNQVIGNFNNGANNIIGIPGAPSAPIPVTVGIPLTNAGSLFVLCLCRLGECDSRPSR